MTSLAHPIFLFAFVLLQGSVSCVTETEGRTGW